MIQKVMLFAGTTEGRLLCEFLSEKNIKACVCVTTSYGEQLLPSPGKIWKSAQALWIGRRWKKN